MSNVEVELPLGQQLPFASRLNEIEKRCEYDIDNLVMRYVINSRDALRMTRVIRELAPLVRHSPGCFALTHKCICGLDNLSPDAKALLK